MTTTTAAPSVDAHRPDGRALAVALGVVRPSLPSLPLPPLTLSLVAGRSPLEASGWSADAHGAR